MSFRRPHTLAVVAIVSLAAVPVQAQSIPSAPIDPPPALLTSVFQYRFSGCVDGPIAYDPGHGFTFGRAFCLDGLLTTGVRDPWGGVGAPVWAAYLTYAVEGNWRIGTPYAEFGDVQAAYGADGRVVVFDFPRGPIGSQWWMADIPGASPATWQPTTIRVTLGYPMPDDGSFGSMQADFRVAPEPHTLALLGLGAGLLAATARRRRSRS